MLAQRTIFYRPFFCIIGYIVLLMCLSNTALPMSEGNTEDTKVGERVNECVRLGEQGQFKDMLKLIDQITQSEISVEHRTTLLGLRLWGMKETSHIEKACNAAFQELVAGDTEYASGMLIMFFRDILSDTKTKENASKYVPLLEDAAEHMPTTDSHILLTLVLSQYNILNNQYDKGESLLVKLKKQVGYVPKIETFLKNNVWDELKRMGRVEDAVRWMDSIQFIYPELKSQPDFLVNYGMVLYEKKDYNKATQIFQDIIADFPTRLELFSRIFWGMAISAIEMGNYAMAREYLDEVLKYAAHYNGSIDFDEQVKIRKQEIYSKTITLFSDSKGNTPYEVVEQIIHESITSIPEMDHNISMKVDERSKKIAAYEPTVTDNHNIVNKREITDKEYNSSAGKCLMIVFIASGSVLGACLILAITYFLRKKKLCRQ